MNSLVVFLIVALACPSLGQQLYYEVWNVGSVGRVPFPSDDMDYINCSCNGQQVALLTNTSFTGPPKSSPFYGRLYMETNGVRLERTPDFTFVRIDMVINPVKAEDVNSEFICTYPQGGLIEKPLVHTAVEKNEVEHGQTVTLKAPHGAKKCRFYYTVSSNKPVFRDIDLDEQFYNRLTYIPSFERTELQISNMGTRDEGFYASRCTFDDESIIPTLPAEESEEEESEEESDEDEDYDFELQDLTAEDQIIVTPAKVVTATVDDTTTYRVHVKARRDRGFYQFNNDSLVSTRYVKIGAKNVELRGMKRVSKSHSVGSGQAFEVFCFKDNHIVYEDSRRGKNDTSIFDVNLQPRRLSITFHEVTEEDYGDYYCYWGRVDYYARLDIFMLKKIE